jgi:hypothetical protein
MEADRVKTVGIKTLCLFIISVWCEFLRTLVFEQGQCNPREMIITVAARQGSR